jgi:hypothetical protein
MLESLDRDGSYQIAQYGAILVGDAIRQAM